MLRSNGIFFFLNRLNAGHEKKGVKDDTKIFGLNNWKKKLLSTEMGKAMKEEKS